MTNDLYLTETRLTCDGQSLKNLLAASLSWLEHNHQYINTLNVFPVPDGDTGTNMLLTMRSAYNEIAEMDDASINVVARAISHGALMGARGNSGVILSQLWRGFARAMDDLEYLDGAYLAQGLREACDTAYKGVIKPVEGTILTVSREIAEEAEAAAEDSDDLIVMMERIVRRANEAVERTPEQLPVLKQAGVVDSGGKGLAVILEGMLMYAQGQYAPSEAPAEAAVVEAVEGELPGEDVFAYPYDVQFIIKGENLDVSRVRDTINAMGDSTLVVGDTDTIKVHVHVQDPGKPISYGISLGAIDDVVVENMLLQSQAFFGQQDHPPAGVLVPSSAPNTPHVEVKAGDIAAVAVVSGEGLTEVYRSLGVAYIVSGGQSMNPSTEQLLEAVTNLPTNQIVILPNNKNILLAAQQAAELAQAQGDDVRVVPTITLPQGISAMMGFNAEGELDKVVQSMSASKDLVATAEITTATRSVEIDNIAVQDGQIIGLIDGKLVQAGNDLNEIVLGLLDKMQVTQYELITLYYGKDVSDADAEALAEHLRERYTEQDIEVVHGGQPHYHYIISTE
jgi:hypothetical protein